VCGVTIAWCSKTMIIQPNAYLKCAHSAFFLARHINHTTKSATGLFPLSSSPLPCLSCHFSSYFCAVCDSLFVCPDGSEKSTFEWAAGRRELVENLYLVRTDTKVSTHVRTNRQTQSVGQECMYAITIGTQL